MKKVLMGMLLACGVAAAQSPTRMDLAFYDGTEAGSGNPLHVNCTVGCSGGTQYAEDTAHVSGDSVTLAGVLQQTADAAISTDLDRSLLQVDATGWLKINCKVGCAGGTQYTEDDAAAANPVGAAQLLVRQDTPATLVTTDGDNVARRGTNYGAAYTQVVTSAGAFVDTFGGGTQYAVDAALGATPTGTLAIAIRDDALSALTPVDGDAIGVRVDANGALWVIPSGTTIVGDGAGALNTIVDSGTLTAVTSITNTVTVSDGAGALNVICDSGCAGGTQYAVDAALGATPTGTLAIAIRDDALSALTPVEDDAIGLRVDANGALWVIPSGTTVVGDGSGAMNVIVDSGTLTAVTSITNSVTVTDGAGAMNVIIDSGTTAVTLATAPAAIAKDEDSASANLDTGVQVLAIRDDTLNVRSGAENDYEPLHTDAAGALWTHAVAADGTDIGSVDILSIVPGVGVTNLGKAEDSASVDLDVGVSMLCIRDDTLNVRSGAENDYEPCHTDASGAVYVNVNNTVGVGNVATIGTSVTPGTAAAHLGKPEDGPIASGDTGIAMLGQAEAAPSATAANNDYIQIKTNANGVLWTQPISTSATGAAPPATAGFIAGLTSGATGGFLTGIPVCDSFFPIDIVTATTTLVVTGVSGRHVRICSLRLVTAAANNVSFIAGTGATCGTSTAGMNGGVTGAEGENYAANGGSMQGSGIGAIMQTETTGDSVCIITTAGTQLSGTIGYAIY